MEKLTEFIVIIVYICVSKKIMVCDIYDALPIEIWIHIIELSKEFNLLLTNTKFIKLYYLVKTHKSILKKIVKNGYFENLKYIIENRIIVITNINDVLLLACKYGNLPIVKYLVSKGADISAEQNSPIKNATYYGHLDVVKYLVSNGAKFFGSYSSAIIIASSSGKLDIVKYFVPGKIYFCLEMEIALVCATENKHTNIVDYLNSMRSSYFDKCFNFIACLVKNFLPSIYVY